MALFGSKRQDGKKLSSKPKAAGTPRTSASAAASGVRDVLLRSRITEKAANLTAANVYTFDVRVDATKKEIAAAVQSLYKVTPIKVHVVNRSGRNVAMRRKRGLGKTARSRKAYVFLRKGEEIKFA